MDCRNCGSLLVIGENWSEALKKNYSYLCLPCNSQRGKDWFRKKHGPSPGPKRGPQTPEHIAKRTATAQANLTVTPVKCVECGDEFIRTAPHQTYCSGRCWQRMKARDRYAKQKQHRLKISPTLYKELEEQFGTVCNICGIEQQLPNGRGKGRLAVDHCHETGLIRGLLCHRCNTVLGLMKDNATNLMKAAKYLNEGNQPNILVGNGF